MKKKKDNKGFVENEEFNGTLFDSHVESSKQQYLPFYDDVCSVKMESDHDMAIVQSDGVSYDMGAVVVPLFDLFVEPKNCVDVAKGNDLGPYFAIFWRPVEEKK